MSNFIQRFDGIVADLPPCTKKEIDLYNHHHSMLIDWNTRKALVSRKSIEGAIAIHYADSIFISAIARPYVKNHAYDLGTGAGFPGSVFAIRYPEIAVTLFERSLKKREFLDSLIRELKLLNVTLLDEPRGRGYKGLFFARAVIPREKLLPYISNLISEQSVLITNLGSEKKNLDVPLPFLKVEEKEYTLPLDQGGRRIEILKKVSRGTKIKYPR